MVPIYWMRGGRFPTSTLPLIPASFSRSPSVNLIRATYLCTIDSAVQFAVANEKWDRKSEQARALAHVDTLRSWGMMSLARIPAKNRKGTPERLTVWNECNDRFVSAIWPAIITEPVIHFSTQIYNFSVATWPLNSNRTRVHCSFGVHLFAFIIIIRICIFGLPDKSTIFWNNLREIKPKWAYKRRRTVRCNAHRRIQKMYIDGKCKAVGSSDWWHSFEWPLFLSSFSTSASSSSSHRIM